MKKTLRRATATAILLALPALAVGQVYQTISKSTDVTAVPQPVGLRAMEQATVRLDWRFTTGTATPRNLTNATSVTFYYDAGVTATGSVTTATNGQVSVTLTPAQTATNGTFNWVLSVVGDTTLATAYGTINLAPNPLASPQVALLTGTNINWGVVAAYQNSGSGPTIGDGTTISQVTNATGQLVLSVTSSATGSVTVATLNLA
ncbi:MAG: hypothetical protein FJ388_23945, partial [Verrucomicrobia bacterium]|nr:hypothetical protein [Verrucomicrobiota bacterium]